MSFTIRTYYVLSFIQIYFSMLKLHCFYQSHTLFKNERFMPFYFFATVNYGVQESNQCLFAVQWKDCAQEYKLWNQL